MKKFYSKFRIGLITFALGLASVFMMNGSLKLSNDIPVVLPKTQTESPIIVFPRRKSETLNGSFWGGGTAGGAEFKKLSIRKTKQ